MVINRSGVIKVRENESLGKVLLNVSLQGIAEEAQGVKRGEDPVSNKFGVRLPIERVGEVKTEAANLNRIREQTAINDNTQNGCEIKLARKSLAANDEDLCFARIQGKGHWIGPNLRPLGHLELHDRVQDRNLTDK